MNATPLWQSPLPQEPTEAAVVRLPRVDMVDPQHGASTAGHPRYRPVPRPSIVAYELGTEGHTQRGLVVEVAVADHRAGRIRGHEATEPDRVRRLVERAERTEREEVPVVLAQPHAAELDDLVNRASACDPDVVVTGPARSRHRVWQNSDPELLHQFNRLASQIRTLYIADGHHRMAAACAYADRHGIPGAPSATDANSTEELERYTLAVVLSAERLRIRGYHRCIPWPAGLSAADLIAKLSARSVVYDVHESPSGPPEVAPGVVGMYAAGHWFRLRLHTTLDPLNTRAGLDIVRLDEDVVAPLLGVNDVGPWLMPLPGDRGATELESWCQERQAIGFWLHPPTVEEVFAVADADQLLPPKSTWFEPKAAAGLFCRHLR